MRSKDGGQEQLKADRVSRSHSSGTQTCWTALHSHFDFFFFFLLGVKSLGPSPTLEGSVQNLELKFCSRATVKCASGTVGAVKVCARTPGVCSCALLKLYCLCRRERVRPTRLFFYFFFFTSAFTYSTLPLFLVLSFCLDIFPTLWFSCCVLLGCCHWVLVLSSMARMSLELVS